MFTNMRLKSDELRGDIGGVGASNAIGCGFERQLTFGECETIREREEADEKSCSAAADFCNNFTF